MLALLALACARRAPADPTSGSPPPLAAPDWGTEPLADATPLEQEVLEELRWAAGARQGVELDGDQRLSRVARAVAFAVAGGAEPPLVGELGRMAAEAGSPYVVTHVAVERVARGKRLRDALAGHVGAVPGSGLPIVAGVGAWAEGDDAVVALVFSRRAFLLEEPLPRTGAAELRIRASPPLPGTFALGLLAIDAAGEHRVDAPAGEDGPHALALPVQDGPIEILRADGGDWSIIGALAVGDPGALPRPDPMPADAAEAVARGADALRAAWGLPPMRHVGQRARLDVVPDLVDGVEVRRTQRAVALPLRGADPWTLVASRPSALRVLAWPEAEVLAVGVADDTLTVRAMMPFERLDPDALDHRLAAFVEERWPGARREEVPGLADVVRSWAATRDVATEPWNSDTVDATVRWIVDGRYATEVWANQDPDTFPALLPEGEVRRWGLAAVLGAGPSGEPLYYAVFGADLGPAGD